MNKIVYPLLVIVSLVALSSCTVRVNKDKFLSELGDGTIVSNGKDTTKTVELEAFSTINNYGSVRVEFIYSDEIKAEIYGPDNVVDYVAITNDNGNLIVDFSKRPVKVGSVFRDCVLYVRVYGPSVAEFNIIGSGDIYAPKIHEDSFRMSIVGSGDISIDSMKAESLYASITGSGDLALSGMVAGKVESSISGSGDITYSGMAESLDVTIAGSGDVDIEDLTCDKVTSDVSGSGEIVR